jgi:phosphatidylglycerophosphatase A
MSPADAVASLAAPERPRAGPLAWSIGTLCGLGLFPLAPGTLGSAAAAAAGWALLVSAGPWAVAALAASLSVAGLWAAGRLAAARGVQDPPEAVVDEAAGMLLALAFLPAAWEFVGAAFFLFRILDITKPWPADRMERLAGGLGIVADDLVVGLYTNLLLQVAAAWVLA